MNGKKGNLGTDVSVRAKDNTVIIATSIPFSKRCAESLWCIVYCVVLHCIVHTRLAVYCIAFLYKVVNSVQGWCPTPSGGCRWWMPAWVVTGAPNHPLTLPPSSLPHSLPPSLPPSSPSSLSPPLPPSQVPQVLDKEVPKEEQLTGLHPSGGQWEERVRATLLHGQCRGRRRRGRGLAACSD